MEIKVEVGVAAAHKNLSIAEQSSNILVTVPVAQYITFVLTRSLLKTIFCIDYQRQKLKNTEDGLCKQGQCKFSRRVTKTIKITFSICH